MHQQGRGALDLVFLVDATGSMGRFIQEVRQRLLELVSALQASPLCQSLRLGLVSYRDHPPQCETYVTRKTPLTDNLDEVRDEVLKLAAKGGGDGPEAVTAGLFDVVRLNWRPDAAKAVVWFGDAPPHGVEPSGDTMPNGCPSKNHWHTQAQNCREMGVAIYAIGCLPGLRSYVNADAVVRQVARTTRGMFLLLRESFLLVPLIAGAAVTELDRQRVEEHVSALVQGWREPLAAADEPERIRWLTHALREKGVQPRSMAADEQGNPSATLRFRELTPQDVSAALERLRLCGRVPF